MIASDWTGSNFFALSTKQQHKKSSELLRKIYEGDSFLLPTYRKVESWLVLPSLDIQNVKSLSERFHYHVTEAGLAWQEHNLLSIRKEDRPSSEPFLSICIYLDNLRSAFNVGSILRTTEALRLGSVYFSGSTPFIDNKKVQKTSMGTFHSMPCFPHADLSSLPRPLIGLETADFAPSLYEFSFPLSFTLLLGNEEYGLSQTSLSQVDALVQIPLYGAKNSLNVASAFAIAASEIRRQALTSSHFHRQT